MHGFTPILARSEGFGELIIWLVMGAIWLFSFIAERVRKRNAPPPAKPAPPPPRPAGENRDLEELQRQLRRMLGAPETEDEPPARTTPEPAPASALPALPARRPAPAVLQFDGPPPLPARTSPPSSQPAETGEVDAFAAVAEIVDIEDAMKQPAARSASVVNPNQFLVNLSKLKLPLLRTPVMTMATVKSVVTPPAVRDPATLRQTMIGSILLAPPKGLD